ncbi:fatty acid biosynthesis 1 [Actinidia rufa]|uniref:beta-ketoacyl-[acyl-carrier-protein] synthase I n=1 Tax=Actinidia rufa TaxID=165716 RepID=A0A7J0E272_9ERIC|nr:fatty acid biosynthesis 1 [Actinidia rufa]
MDSSSSAVCTWLVAACMSLACDKQKSFDKSSFFVDASSIFAQTEAQGFEQLHIQGPNFVELHSESHELVRALRSILQLQWFRIDLWIEKRSRVEAMAIAGQPAKEVTAEKRSPTKQRKVVVTGMAVETPVGDNPDVFYNNLLDGVSGISEIEAFDCAHFPTKIAGEIKSYSTDGWVSPKLSKRMDKFMLYMLTAGKKAIADGGLTEEVMKEIDKARCGILIGSAMGGMKGWMGPNYSISTACATSNFCILNAANHIIRGEADMMLCGGSDAAIIPIGLGGFVACRALSQRNSDPAKASRPWDIKRGANIYAEFLGGSFTCDAYHMTEPHPEVLLRLEASGMEYYVDSLQHSNVPEGGDHVTPSYKLEDDSPHIPSIFTSSHHHHQSSGIGVLGTTPGARLSSPYPYGEDTGRCVVLCIEKALTQSGVSREDVNYVNAHATSTPAGDLKEYKALIRCFGHNPELRVNSTKSMIGHLLGGAGAVEAVATVQVKS